MTDTNGTEKLVSCPACGLRFSPTVNRSKFVRDFCSAVIDVLGPVSESDWLESAYRVGCKVYGAGERRAVREELLVMAQDCRDNAKDPATLWLEKAQAYAETMESLS